MADLSATVVDGIYVDRDELLAGLLRYMVNRAQRLAGGTCGTDLPVPVRVNGVIIETTVYEAAVSREELYLIILREVRDTRRRYVVEAIIGDQGRFACDPMPAVFHRTRRSDILEVTQIDLPQPMFVRPAMPED